MTQEELKKKAEEYSVIYFPNNEFNQAIVKKAYLAGAKEMQAETLKEIIETEKVSDFRWEENEQLKQSNWELLIKIEKMKNCGNCNGIRDGIRDEKCKQCFKHKDLRYWELAE